MDIKSSGSFAAESLTAAFIGAALDDHRFKEAEEKVLASSTKLEAALASMTDAVFISDDEGRFVE